MEGVLVGTAKLVGTNKDAIVREALFLLTDSDAYSSMSKTASPYGDGSASLKIVNILKNASF